MTEVHKKFIHNENSLINGFLESVKKFPEKTALWVKGSSYSYSKLYEEALRIASHLIEYSAERCIIYTEKTWVAYAGMLASLLSGKTYVPMRPRIPHERNLLMLSQIETDLMIIDNQSWRLVKELLRDYPKKLNLVLPDTIPESKDIPFVASHNVTSQTHIINRSKHQAHLCLNDSPLSSFKQSQTNPYAYLLFTSGSTGVPKGVPVKHENVLHYIDVFVERVKPNSSDRFLQLADLTFDFSVHDCFPAWAVGACVYAFSDDNFLDLANFINRHELTFWGSVPSMAILIKNLRKLTAGQLPSLRYSMFCGEAFSEQTARMWAILAPNSIIENFYGPTEGAVCFTGYTWNKNNKREDNNIIPIGRPFRDLEIILVDGEHKPVINGEIGELLLSGPQVVDGYWKNEELTNRYFIFKINKSGKMQSWYRTGDLAYLDTNGVLCYRGRCDDQIQIRGSRVEKLEIEAVVKKAANTEFAAVIPWPCTKDGIIFGVIAYVSGTTTESRQILDACRSKFPDCMVPSEIHYLDKLPYNMNGKLDYRALKELREQYEYQNC